MPLPLPNLDTRRWADLVDEGRALIPRYAPAWTDHNIHDPGITLMELLAWLVEQDIYRVNRVPERHRLKFLALAGFAPQPPRPAQAILTFSLAPGASLQTIPAGVTFAAGDDHTPLRRFRSVAPVTLIPAQIKALQVFNGLAFIEQTQLWRDRLPFPLLGANPQPAGPEQQPAFYLGFDQALPPGETVTLWFWFAGGRSGQTERDRLVREAQQAAEACRPLRPQTSCTPVPPPPDPWCPPGDEMGTAPAADGNESPLPPHHTARTVWEYFDGSAWQPLDPAAGHVEDDTRAFTLDGPVRFSLPGPMASQTLGAVAQPYFYLRCRMAAGPPDAAPLVADVGLNAVPVEQTSPARSTLVIAPGVAPPAGQEPVAGERQNLRLLLNPTGVITELAAGTGIEGPEAFILNYQPAAANTPGALTLTLVPPGLGTGLPGQQVVLPEAPIANGEARLWTLDTAGAKMWRQRRDLDASRRTDPHFMLDPTAGTVSFGDGENGQVVPAGATILAAYEVTAGAQGNVPAGAAWRLSGADDALNQVLLGGGLTMLAEAIAGISSRAAAVGGANEETLAHAAGRAAEALWAHERLLELCELHRCSSLDQLDRSAVLGRAAPPRAVTLLDYERIALEIPGTQISRAKAWAGLDPLYPCLKAPGTVTVVVMPGLPLGRPEPTPGLIDQVRRYLDRRRVIGTRLVVVGPSYLTVSVRAAVRLKNGTDPARVQAQVLADLNTFLDPLRGGPDGRGWPFGRDVYRSEVLQVIDNVTGVDHVLSLELVAGQGEGQCGNLCVGPTWLVTPGEHKIEVNTGEMG